MDSLLQARAMLSRRTFLITGTALAGAVKAMPSTPACVLTAEQEEGPYYVDYGKVRRDITEGKAGVPVRLRIGLVNSRTCEPLKDALVDIWHCDASGIYSGFTAMNPSGGPGGRPGGPGGFGPPPGGGPPPDGFGGPPPFMKHGPMDSTRFLRGVQASDGSGLAEFATIFPGWYQGRAVHIHMKVHTGGRVSHTGQLFFPEEAIARVEKMKPYVGHRAVHRTTQDEDDIFESQHGAAGLVSLNRLEQKSDAGGFMAAVTIAVDPEATPEVIQRRPPGERESR